MQDEIELLRSMMGDQDRQSSIYQPGPYWRGYQQRTARAIERHGLSDFRARADIGKGYADTLTTSPDEQWLDQSSMRYKIKQALMTAPALRTLFGEYRTLVGHHITTMQRYAGLYYQHRFGNWFEAAARQYDLPPSLHAGCRRHVTLGGEAIAQTYVDFLMRFHNFGQHLDFSEVRVAFEIGGGFGAWPHLLLSMYPNVRKIVYLDIPPMIYVGTQYLKHFFGDAVIDYRQTKDLEKISFRDDDSREILCLCSWQIEKLDIKADLFWNTASFSEMTPDIVGNYATHVARCLKDDDAKICLLLNKVEPHPDHKITLPDEVSDAFGPGFEFKDIEAEVEHPTHSLYRLGQRK
jgi:putative sugar O-methyltransferase